VRHTSAVTAGKLERFAALGLPWAEVVASRALYAEFTAWRADTPLTVLRTRESARWWCADHRHAVRAPGERPRGVEPWVARVVDRYLPSGRVRREIVYVEGRRRGRRVHDAAVRDRAGALIAALPDGEADRVLAGAHAAFRRWARERRRVGELVDSPMSWSPPPGCAAPRWGGRPAPRSSRGRYVRAGGTWARRPGADALRWEPPAAPRRDAGRGTAPSGPAGPPSRCVRRDPAAAGGR
jgi:hypothetical protein